MPRFYSNRNHRLLTWLLVLLAACQRTPDATLIRDHITAMVKAVETRDNAGFLAHVAETYRDDEGRDLRGLRQLLLANFMQHSNILVLVSDVTIDVRADKAEAQLRVQLTSGEQLIADRRFGAYRVHTLWKKQDRDWQLFQARWEPVDGG
jgi:hypothetical protein